MKFVSVRDLRGKSADIWRELPGEREMVITSNGRSSAMKTRLLAIPPTSHPRAAAASAAVRAESGRTTTSLTDPAAASASCTLRADGGS